MRPRGHQSVSRLPVGISIVPAIVALGASHAESGAPQGPAMRVRKNALSLSRDEKAAYVQALLRLKKEGRYDEYVHWHHHVMNPTVLPHEPRDSYYRNGAHRGPAFLPWHREFLMQVEDDLQRID